MDFKFFQWFCITIFIGLIQEVFCSDSDEKSLDCAVDTVSGCFDPFNSLWTCYEKVKSKDNSNKFCNKIRIPLETYPQEICKYAEQSLFCTTNLLGYGCPKDFFEQWYIPLLEIHSRLCKTPSKNVELNVLVESHECWVDFIKPSILDKIMNSLGDTSFFHLFTKNMDDSICMNLLAIINYHTLMDTTKFGAKCENATRVIGDLINLFVTNSVCSMPSNAHLDESVASTQPTASTTKIVKIKNNGVELPLRPLSTFNQVVKYAVSNTENMIPFNILLFSGFIFIWFNNLNKN